MEICDRVELWEIKRVDALDLDHRKAALPSYPPVDPARDVERLPVQVLCGLADLDSSLLEIPDRRPLDDVPLIEEILGVYRDGYLLLPPCPHVDQVS